MSSDEQLIEQLQQGRTSALDTLYSRYARRLYVFCAHAAQVSDQEAQDLTQDVFVRVIKAAHTFNPQKASFRTWLFRIARNHCIDSARRRSLVQFIPMGTGAQRDGASEAPSLQDVLPNPGDSVEETMIHASAIQAVRDCIAELRQEDERQAILLYYLGGRVYREIGEILGESLSMARNRVKAAQEKVRQCLERKGIDAPN